VIDWALAPKITIKSIFLANGNWERFKAENPNLPFYVVDEVEKMLHCRDPEYGFLTFKCPKCGDTKTIPLACKSRNCTRCGKAYTDEWADKLVSSLYAVSHRHMVFTIPEEFRDVLGVDHSLYKVLMDACSAQNSDTLRLKLPRDATSCILFFINFQKMLMQSLI